MIKMTKSRESFIKNAKDVTRLFNIHEQVAGTKPGKKTGVEVLNKSAIVLTAAIWEAFCEDLLRESVTYVVTNTNDPNILPVSLRKSIADSIRKNTNELECWALANDGWKRVLASNANAIINGWTGKLNTPSSKNIVKLFSFGIGLDDITQDWKWKNMNVAGAATKLDGFLDLRHQVAHRGKASGKSVLKPQGVSFLEHVNTLSEKTEATLNLHVKNICGTGLLD